jgi:hypothetical protein
MTEIVKFQPRSKAVRRMRHEHGSERGVVIALKQVGAPDGHNGSPMG